MKEKEGPAPQERDYTWHFAIGISVLLIAVSAIVFYIAVTHI